MVRRVTKKCVVFSKEELQAMELAMHYQDGRHGIGKSMKDLEPSLTRAHEKVAKELDKIPNGWK